MDSWSRPSKSQAAPPPFYLTQGGDSARYCHTCGRIIGSRRTNSSKSSATEVKYCSDKCKRNKPTSVDQSIEQALLSFLQGADPSEAEPFGDNGPMLPKAKQRVKKGDPRIIVKMSDLETAAFGNMKDPERVYGRNKNRAKRGLPDPEEWRSVDMVDGDVQQSRLKPVEVFDSSAKDDVFMEPDMVPIQDHIRPAQANSDVNGSIGGEKGWSEKIEESPEMLQKRLEGQKRAENRELVRNAARRAVAFGLWVDNVQTQPEEQQRKKNEEPERVLRKCEALVNGAVVDPSFAKGDWSIRWRED